VRSNDRSSKYEQTGDRESVTLIVIPPVVWGYGNRSLVWGDDVPGLGDDAELDGLADGVVPGMHLQLGKDGGDVVAHGAPRKKQRIGDFLGSPALSDQRKHLHLAAGKLEGIGLRGGTRPAR
jgi:hypothetical protein